MRVSHPRVGRVAPVEDREACVEWCRTDDVGEYPLLEDANMDLFLVQVRSV